MIQNCRAKQARRFPVLILSILLLSILIQNIRSSSTLIITVNTDKETYGCAEEVHIWGSLTLNSIVITDALVAIEIDDPEGNLLVLRTRPTGAIPDSSLIEILEITPCDKEGRPKHSFERGSLAYFRITLRNNDNSSKYAIVSINTFDIDNVPFEAFIPLRGWICPGTTQFVTSLPIPADTLIGNGTAYANVFTELPRKNGFSYCQERSAMFTIASSASRSAEYTGEYIEGNYNITCRLPYKIGNYTIYVTSYYQAQLATRSKTFKVCLVADLNGDDIVDIFDLVIVAAAYGSMLGDSNWDPRADLNGDGIIDVFDLVIVAIHYGKTV